METPSKRFPIIAIIFVCVILIAVIGKLVRADEQDYVLICEDDDPKDTMGGNCEKWEDSEIKLNEVT